MIIKSMARKAPTFGQLVSYIGRDAEAEAPAFSRNLYHNGADTGLVARQGHLPQAQVHAALLELGEAYCARRVPEQLAWGRGASRC